MGPVDRLLRRSLALHAEVAKRVAAEPALVAKARARVEAWAAEGRIHPRYVSAWRDVLAGSVAEIGAALVDDSERMNDLRQVSPFAGVVDARTRWRILREAG